ncbi:carbonate dehydratase [Pseudoscardovia radai]|uniref:carbonic anhydrase n=2 Tax=Pseudoscardovia radai TaxID=987066 RepID=A0A261EVW0_9BIFI|nr:carbonate dehydratase [Pseudoscardovia radai]
MVGMTSKLSTIDDDSANLIWHDMLEGNRRFAEGKQEHARQDVDTRKGLVDAQHPKAAVLSCADSRVTPEMIFDQGIGDLFCVRSAGSILDSAVVESLEYAVRKLGVKVIVVMTHENCGAIQAAMEGGHDDELPHLMRELGDAVECAKDAELDDPADVERIHAARVIERLVDQSDVIRRAVADDRLYIAGARYAMSTGLVEVLSF